MAPFTRRNFLTKAAIAHAIAVFAPGFATSKTAGERTSQEHHVKIMKFKFVPEILDVKLGDTVIWTNLDIAPHTATSADKSWDTTAIKRGENKSILVNPDMAVDYICLFHPQMKASLNLIDKNST